MQCNSIRGLGFRQNLSQKDSKEFPERLTPLKSRKTRGGRIHCTTICYSNCNLKNKNGAWFHQNWKRMERYNFNYTTNIKEIKKESISKLLHAHNQKP